MQPERQLAELMAIGSFRSFWLANLLSNLGTSAYMMAISWLTVRNYGAAGIGILTLGYGIPQFLLQLVGGSTSDRHNRKLLFFTTESSLMLASLVLLLVSFRGLVPLWLLVAVQVVNGTIAAFDTPARTALIGEMVRQEKLVIAQQTYSVSSSLTSIFGPALGGVLLSLGTGEGSHEEYAFLFNTLSFVPLLACVPCLPRGSQQLSGSKAPVSFLTSLREGLSFVQHQRSVGTLLQLLAVVMLLGMPFQTLLPIFVHSHLSLTTGHGFYAALLSAVGLGAFLGSLLGMQLGEGTRPGRLLFSCCVGLGLAILLLCASRVVHWASLAAFLAGGCGTLAINLDNALISGLTPMAMQGRVASIANLSKSLQAFTAAAASGLIHLIAHKAATPAGYLEVQVPLALLLVIAGLVLRPGLWRLGRPNPAAVQLS
jgi:MFS family permease